eukprot:1357670-Rhodomonas_salina.1
MDEPGDGHSQTPNPNTSNSSLNSERFRLELWPCISHLVLVSVRHVLRSGLTVLLEQGKEDMDAFTCWRRFAGVGRDAFLRPNQIK